MSLLTHSEESAVEAPRGSAQVAPHLLQVEGLAKRFCRDLRKSLLYGVMDIGREALGRPPRTDWLRSSEFWALSDIGFSVRRGEAVGLVGKNGSGKTTLMRILSGLIKPTVGRVVTRGRVAPLLALGAGFNPVLTGRENIYVNMSVLGLTRDEIDERFDEVVAFSEIEYALDAPVQNYSSGMTARLGFSCAIHTAPDILLIDEVMAVGDLQFRQKCQAKLREMRNNGTTFIIVNHSPSLPLAVCTRGVYLQQGQMLAYGDIDAVVEQYERNLYQASGETHVTSVDFKSTATEGFEFTNIQFLQHGVVSTELTTGRNASLRVEMRVKQSQSRIHFVVRCYRLPSEDHISGMDEELIVQFPSNQEGQVFWMESGARVVELPLEPLVFAPGSYQVKVEAFDAEDRPIGSRRSPSVTVMAEGYCRHSEFYQPHRWEIEDSEGIGRRQIPKKSTDQ